MDECTDFVSINKTEVSIDDNSKIYSCDDLPIYILDIAME